MLAPMQASLPGSWAWTIRWPLLTVFKGTEMKKKIGSKEELDAYIESVKARQRNTVWPDVLRGSRSVDELLWKGARDAPLVQRIGAVILALAYLMVAMVFVSMAVEQGKWFIGAFAAILFGVGGWFIRNALRK
jgi:hypothetical protein